MQPQIDHGPALILDFSPFYTQANIGRLDLNDAPPDEAKLLLLLLQREMSTTYLDADSMSHLDRKLKERNAAAAASRQNEGAESAWDIVFFNTYYLEIYRVICGGVPHQLPEALKKNWTFSSPEAYRYSNQQKKYRFDWSCPK